MSQFVYLEVITAADMFHICLHPGLHDASSSGLCSVEPHDKMECDNSAGKGRSAVRVRFHCIAGGRVSAVFFCAGLGGGSAKLEKKLCSRAAPRPLMPSSCLPSACMHVLIRALLYLYHHQAFRALHQHKVFTLTCTAEEKWWRVSSYCDWDTCLYVFFFTSLTLSFISIA